MRAGWLALWLLVHAAPAAAQTIIVRSGDHADFTRLTFALPPGVSWQLRDDGPAPRLVVSAVDPFFDVSTVFRRIDRGRLRDLRVEGSEVAFDLACDCSLAAFDAGSNLLAVDIRDAPSAARPAPVARLWTLPEGYSFGVSMPDARPAIPQPVPVAPPAARPQTVAMTPDTLFPGAALLPVLDGAVLPSAQEVSARAERDARVDRAREALAMQLGRAASTGLIDLARPVPVPRPEGTAAAAAAAEAPVVMRPPVNLSAMTALDIAAADRRLAGHVSIGPSCPGEEAFAIADWAGEGDFPTELAKLRGRLFGEFDQIDPTAGRDLVRLYLHYGFGREALQLLSLLPDTKESGILSDMARIVEDVPPLGIFDGQAMCDGDVALWAMLTSPGSTQEVVPAVAAVERAFMRLPDGLQTLLGERVADGMMAAGAGPAADRTLRRILRSAPDGAPEALVAEAGLASKRGAQDEAEASLRALARAEAAGSPAAVVALSDLHWDEHRAPSPDLVALSASLATEMRRAETGPALRLAQMRLKALSGDYDAATAALREIAARDGAGAAQRAHADLLTELTRSAGDADMLRLALTAPMPVVSGLSDASGNRLAERLLDLGFPAAAERFLQAPARIPDGDQRLRLRARAAIAQGDLVRAEAQLSGATGPEADRMRADVLRLQGNLAEAADILRRIDDRSAERLAWMTDRPVAGATDAAASAYAPIEVPTAPVTRPELAAASDLIDRSQTVRDRVSDLLSRHAAPPG